MSLPRSCSELEAAKVPTAVSAPAITCQNKPPVGHQVSGEQVSSSTPGIWDGVESRRRDRGNADSHLLALDKDFPSLKSKQSAEGLGHGTGDSLVLVQQNDRLALHHTLL